MPSLHVDTNNEGTYRCATVIIYLNDVPAGYGGETRFPIANEPYDSALRAAGRAALASGATALFPGAASRGSPAMTVAGSDASAAAAAASAAPASPADDARHMLLRAAESDGTGVHVRPRRGAACVFWTMDKDGIDASTWHNGARVLHGGGGKWIAQKFKELPPAFRAARPLVLPAECQCAPPAMAAPARPPATVTKDAPMAPMPIS